MPLHNWLPDAHAEGPTPISAVLSGLLLNVALYAVVRCKVLVEGALQNGLPGHLMMGFGLLSVLVATFFAVRGRRTSSGSFRLFVDRAHGHHHVRLRAGRPRRELRGPAAHDGAFADEVGDLLHRRARGAEGRHAADRRHPRACYA